MDGLKIKTKLIEDQTDSIKKLKQVRFDSMYYSFNHSVFHIL